MVSGSVFNHEYRFGMMTCLNQTSILVAARADVYAWSQNRSTYDTEIFTYNEIEEDLITHFETGGLTPIKDFTIKDASIADDKGPIAVAIVEFYNGAEVMAKMQGLIV
jgi:uncharacterized OB-fold protein